MVYCPGALRVCSSPWRLHRTCPPGPTAVPATRPGRRGRSPPHRMSPDEFWHIDYPRPMDTATRVVLVHAWRATPILERRRGSQSRYKHVVRCNLAGQRGFGNKSTATTGRSPLRA